MNAGVDMAAVAALVGDPARANMLAAMLDGRAHTAGELAALAGVSAPTASGHLAKLTHGGLVDAEAQGRHRYFRLASAEVAEMLETIMIVAAHPPSAAPRATPRIDATLRRARTCYDHIAGELGVAIADALAARGVVSIGSNMAAITAFGLSALKAAGLSLDPPSGSRRPSCRACLDWSERRPHLAGVLGAVLLERALAAGLVRRRDGSRALDVDGDVEGEAALRRLGFPAVTQAAG